MSQYARSTIRAILQHEVALDTEVEVVRNGSGRYDVVVDSPYETAHLVVNDSFYPGWRATVDGAPAPIEQANHRFMAVPVARGPHRVMLEYTSTYFVPGLALTGFGLLACALVYVRSRPG